MPLLRERPDPLPNWKPCCRWNLVMTFPLPEFHGNFVNNRGKLTQDLKGYGTIRSREISLWLEI
jgi:hypothetical protein